MRPLRYSINVTLDGCVDHREGNPTAALHEHAAQMLARADGLLLGRVIYQMMEEGWRHAADDEPFGRVINEARKHVVSSTLTHVDWNAELVQGDLAEAVQRLKEEPGEGLYVGGVMLPTALAGLGLIDEYTFVVHPHVAGHGPYLFGGLPAPQALEAVDRTDLGDGIVATTYRPVP